MIWENGTGGCIANIFFPSIFCICIFNATMSFICNTSNTINFKGLSNTFEQHVNFKGLSPICFFFKECAFCILSKKSSHPKGWDILKYVCYQNFTNLLLYMYDSLQVNFYVWCEIMIQLIFFSFCLSNCPSTSC